jgi:hypothetical protein
MGSADGESNAKAGNEGRCDRCPLVWKLMGSMIAMSIAPNTTTQTTPSILGWERGLKMKAAVLLTTMELVVIEKLGLLKTDKLLICRESYNAHKA